MKTEPDPVITLGYAITEIHAGNMTIKTHTAIKKATIRISAHPSTQSRAISVINHDIIFV